MANVLNLREIGFRVVIFADDQLRGPRDHVGVGHDPVAVDEKTCARGAPRQVEDPWRRPVRLLEGSEDLDDRLLEPFPSRSLPAAACLEAPGAERNPAARSARAEVPCLNRSAEGFRERAALWWMAGCRGLEPTRRGGGLVFAPESSLPRRWRRACRWKDLSRRWWRRGGHRTGKKRDGCEAKAGATKR